ncbi:MAG: tRNA 2-methylthio-N6-isopentenyl adenosine(37) hydroxylase MiaE [Myxococcales bacterium]|nr:MAG: tRNA 2-methylthio-N6-isopentenyl adenosine(37) hydroxylase MiaE [Myxococcales bacterium]
MLGLLCDTDPSWVEAAQADLDALLSDHAHCEVKAAHTALSLVAKFAGEQPSLAAPLSALAQEEAEHFGLVHERLASRGSTLGPPSKDPYVNALLLASKELDPGTPLLLDKLLISALVEARSCERFRLLSEKLNDASLRSFYRELMASEARHYRLFRELSEQCFGLLASKRRFEHLAEYESKVASQLPLGPTVHG